MIDVFRKGAGKLRMNKSNYYTLVLYFHYGNRSFDGMNDYMVTADGRLIPVIGNPFDFDDEVKEWPIFV